MVPHPGSQGGSSLNNTWKPTHAWGSMCTPRRASTASAFKRATGGSQIWPGLPTAPTGRFQPLVDLHKQHARCILRLHVAELLGDKVLAHSCQAAQVARTNGLKTCVAAKADLEPINAQNQHRRRQTRCDRIQLLTPVSDLKTPIAQMCNLKLDTPLPPTFNVDIAGPSCCQQGWAFSDPARPALAASSTCNIELGAGGVMATMRCRMGVF